MILFVYVIASFALLMESPLYCIFCTIRRTFLLGPKVTLIDGAVLKRSDNNSSNDSNTNGDNNATSDTTDSEVELNIASNNK